MKLTHTKGRVKRACVHGDGEELVLFSSTIHNYLASDPPVKLVYVRELTRIEASNLITSRLFERLFQLFTSPESLDTEEIRELIEYVPLHQRATYIARFLFVKLSVLESKINLLNKENV